MLPRQQLCRSQIQVRDRARVRARVWAKEGDGQARERMVNMVAVAANHRTQPASAATQHQVQAPWSEKGVTQLAEHLQGERARDRARARPRVKAKVRDGWGGRSR